MINDWKDLEFWNIGEWQAIEERLNDLDKQRIPWSPGRKNLFSAMRACPFDKVRCVIMGQDPYPNPAHATGLAFSIPPAFSPKEYPETLKNIFKELKEDLHYPDPPSGSLNKWTKEGVFLWNTIPSCEALKSMSHNWDEWGYLTKEIVEELDQKYIVFILLGRYAREYSKYITKSSVIETSHPSGRGVNFGFKGSRIFSNANAKLIELGLDPINWRLDDAKHSVQT